MTSEHLGSMCTPFYKLSKLSSVGILALNVIYGFIFPSSLLPSSESDWA